MVTTTLLRRKNVAPHSSCLEVTVRESTDITQVKGTLTGRTSASLEEVKLDLSGLFRQNHPNKKLRKLFKALGDLPYLKTLRFHYSIALERLPVHLLTIALIEGRRLEILELNQVNLTGNEKEFALFLDTLRNHASLQVFSFSSSGCSSSSNINELLHSLAAAPRLEKVVLYSEKGRCPWGRLDGAAIHTLCQSTTLRDLQHLVLYDSNTSTGNFFADEHTIALAQALSDNPRSSLTEVMISCWPLGQAGVQALCRMLQTNNTLQKLTMVLYELGDDNNTAGTCNLGELAASLQTNSTLTSLELHGSTELGKWMEDAFLELMESNFALTILKLCSQDEALFCKPYLDFYLRLNAAGRGRLLQNANATKVQWVESLIRVRDDLSCLFYFLSTNPLLCE